VYQLLRGGVYPSFGKPHDGLGFAPTMIEHNHGSTGICGIAWIDRNIWGSDWNDRVLIGNPVNSRVNFDCIEFRGSTPVAIEQPDFVVSDDPWFRPVDLCLADDGALYIADFYNKIIGHYEVPLDHPGRDRERGRIWRVAKQDGVQALRPPIQVETVADPIAALAEDSPFTKRAAASLLQNQPDLEAMTLLLQTLATTADEDTHLRHVLRMALREHLKLPGAFERDIPNHTEIAEIALAVPGEEAAEFLFRHVDGETSQFRLRSLRHIARYRAADTLSDLVFSLRDRPAGKVETLYLAAEIEAIRQGLEERGMFTPPSELLSWADSIARQLLEQRGESGEKFWQSLPHPEFPKSASPWVLQKRQCGDGRELDFLSSLAKGESKAEQRTGILSSQEFEVDGAITFWLCGHRGHPDQSAHEKNYVRLVNSVDGAEFNRAYPPRSDVAVKVAWDLAQHMGKRVRLEIVDGDAGPSFAWLALSRISVEGISVTSFDDASQSSEALRSLADLLKVHASADLRDQLRPFLPAPPAAPPRKISAAERKRLDAVIAARSQGFDASKADPEKGGAIFKFHCAACHQISGEGGVIGPQLDGIGSRGPARLAEDILDPNRNVDAHFYLTTVTRKDGSSLAGFLLAERGEVLVLVDAAGQEIRVAKAEIEKRESTALSLMPAAFDQILEDDQFNDLLAWLLVQRPREDGQK
jgi:putative heme-binding domain-containing protein